MIRIIIQQLAIFLLPIVLYGIYFVIQRRRANRAGQPQPRFEDGPWFWIIFAGAVLSIAAFLIIALVFKESDPNALVVPPSGPQ